MTDKPHPQRKSPRLPEYDYTLSGAYFVTICTHQRLHHFGQVTEDTMELNQLGAIAYQELEQIPIRWQTVDVDLYVVPNHVHVIILITDVGTAFLPSENASQTNPLLENSAAQKTDTKNRVPTLGHIVGSYKAGVSRIARRQKYLDDKEILWQGRYHDHIIRTEQNLNHIREYVVANPARWAEDMFYGKTE
jgi:putative transposase